jgi:hypothetical protein
MWRAGRIHTQIDRPLRISPYLALASGKDDRISRVTLLNRPVGKRNVSTVLRQRARAIYEGKELAAAGTREGGRSPATRGRVRGALGALSPIDASTSGGTAP